MIMFMIQCAILWRPWVRQPETNATVPIAARPEQADPGSKETGDITLMVLIYVMSQTHLGIINGPNKAPLCLGLYFASRLCSV